MNDNKLNIDKIHFPKIGGAYTGLETNYQTDNFSGAFSLDIPIYTSPCRNSEPKLNLKYNSLCANGSFGMGFLLNIPFISRSSESFIPTYNNNEDLFVSSEYGNLVKIDKYETDEYNVFSYKQTNEKNFSRIEFFINKNNSYWKVITNKQSVLIFGYSDNSKIKGNCNKIYRWLLESLTDKNGNKILYEYIEKENNRYIDNIKYGNYFDENSSEKFCFKVAFDYVKRIDNFVTFRPGFPLFTKLLCNKISMIHCFGAEKVVREIILDYYNFQGVSLISQINETGYSYINDKILHKSYPPICFKYNDFKPEKLTFKRLNIKGHNLLNETEKRCYNFIDLYRDGIDGILYNDESSILYFKPLGNGVYDEPEIVKEFPIDKNPEKYTIISLEGNGKYDLVTKLENRSGYYEIDNKSKRFHNFVPFNKCSNQNGNLYSEFADLQGDGLRHMFFSFNNSALYYPSLKKEGFGDVVKTILPKDFPEYIDKSDSMVTFLDIFGDGLQHRIKVYNGYIECWPNLGYGKFGEKISIKNFPYFGDDFDISRLYFADLNGSGTQDLVYVYTDKVDIFLNPSGLYFNPPISIALPEKYTKADKLFFSDIKGNGCKSIVFIKTCTETSYYYLDLCHMIKPYLMKSFSNNRGLKVSVKYKSNISFYLEDINKNILWKSNIPFPINVVSEIKKTDLITGFSLKTKFKYRHGYYNNEKKKVNGFGYIEKIEIRKYKDKENYSLKKYWYYTGRLNESYCDEFNTDDNYNYKIPDSYFNLFNYEYKAYAQNALKGKILRTEIYNGLEKSDLCKVEEYNYTVNELSELNNERISFNVTEREHIIYNYEKNVADPSVKHCFNIEIDPFGNILKSCTIFYPRRIQGEKGQNETVCQAEIFDYINNTKQTNISGIIKEYKKFNINKISIKEGYINFFDIKTQLDNSLKNVIPFGTDFDNINLQSKLEKWEKYFYWNSDLSAELPFGEASENILISRNEKAVFSKQMIDNNFNGIISNKMLEEDCFYYLNEDYWWKSSPTIYYYPKQKFFLKKREYKSTYSRRFETNLKYDNYCLLPIQNTKTVDDKTKLTISAEIDYVSLNYSKIKDENNNTTAFIYDSLGNVCLKTVYSNNDNKTGNENIEKYIIRQDESFENIINNPKLFVQNMSCYYFYDMFSYKERKQPISCIEIMNKDFYCDNKNSEVVCNIEYYSGFDKVIEKRVKSNENWIVKNKKIYNDFGYEIAEYKPYFSESCLFSDLNDKYILKYTTYDVLKRIILQEKPYYEVEGSIPFVFSKIVYEPWREIIYDENDLITDSEYYKKFMENKNREDSYKKDALEKAKKLINTPRIKIFDNRHFKIIENSGNSQGSFVFNNQGKILSISDKRLRQKGLFNYVYVYDMIDNVLCTVSSDTGRTVTLYDSYDKLVHFLDANSNHKIFSYDNLNRHINTYTEGIGETEKIIYGDLVDDAEKYNLKNQIYKRFSQMGQETFELYDIQKKPLLKNTIFCKDYKSDVNWENNSICLNNEVFIEKYKYNSLSEKIYYCSPANNSYKYDYNSFGKIKSIFQINNDGTENCLTVLKYEANEKIKNIYHKNGMTINYLYNNISFNLEYIKTFDNNDKLIQSLKYIYDPIGNVTAIKNEMEINTLFDYTYDENYRLIEATGRELPENADISDYNRIEEYKETYSYDESGNLIKIKHSSLNINWVSEMKIDSLSNKLIKMDENIFKYDENGNMINMHGIENMFWNFDNKLSRIDLVIRENDDSDSEYYVYNHQGVRVKKVYERKTSYGKEITETMYFDGCEIKRIYQSEIVFERSTMYFKSDSVPLFASYIWTKDNYARETKELNVIKNHFYSANAVCSINIEADDHCEIISYEEHYPFGKTAFKNIKAENTPKKIYCYCGKEKDLSGFYYFKSRYYSPFIARMISADDIKYLDTDDIQSVNCYIYCKNNPIRYIDFDGNCPNSFNSACEAVKDFGKNQYALSLNKGVEIASAIYSHNIDEQRFYGYTDPVLGEVDCVDPSGAIKKLQNGHNLEGVVHTHLRTFTFSDADIEYAWEINKPVYLVTNTDSSFHPVHRIYEYVPVPRARRSGKLIHEFN